MDIRMAPKIWEPRDQHSPGSLLPATRVEKRAWVRGWNSFSEKNSFLNTKSNDTLTAHTHGYGLPIYGPTPDGLFVR